MEGEVGRSGEDRISLLPQELICKIVTFLRPKDAVRTSVLSSKWRNLWLEVTTLDLNTAHFRNYDACADYIDIFHKYGTYLSKFKLTIDKHICGHEFFLLEPCLGRVLKRKIQHFEVLSSFGDLIKIPLNNPMCKELVCLSLSLVRLDEFVSLEFPCLKVMNLSHVLFPSNDSGAMLVPCSPVLEELVIRRPFNMVADLDLRFCSKSLKSLSLSHIFYYDGHIGGRNAAEIDAPRLKYLSVKDCLDKIIRVTNISPLAKVELDFIDDSYECRERNRSNSLYDLLTNVSSVVDMTISRSTLMLIYHMKDFNPLPTFQDLSRLSVTMHPYESQKLLPFLLESCPSLKYLTLVLELLDEDYQVEKETKLSRLLPCCLLSSLEYVNIKSPITEQGTELELVRYFLKNSATLKKLVLRLNHSYGEKRL
ncbi:FBD-associated F-box protein At5g18780 [Capsella rubella]|uniref:FBD-associated F-box protein At5g18780 n=1 Tax=Capsella rubella TaxID=81985 RepID=UPI000CD4A8DE|nr:FBD-associated F-box protein At5g18780 [Capsella rubella]